MARRREQTRRDIDNYAHTDKERVNNPPVGLVTIVDDRGVESLKIVEFSQ